MESLLYLQSDQLFNLLPVGFDIKLYSSLLLYILFIADGQWNRNKHKEGIFYMFTANKAPVFIVIHTLKLGRKWQFVLTVPFVTVGW